MLADLFKRTQQATAYPGDDQSKDQQAGEQGKPGTADGVPQVLVGIPLVPFQRESPKDAPAIGQLLLNLDRGMSITEGSQVGTFCCAVWKTFWNSS